MVNKWKKFLIVKQVLLISATGNVRRSVWRICMLILELKGTYGLKSLGIFEPCQDLAVAYRRFLKKELKSVMDNWVPGRRQSWVLIDLSEWYQSDYPEVTEIFFTQVEVCFGVIRRPTDLRPQTDPFQMGHFKDLTKTWNHAWKVSGTHGTQWLFKC